MLTKVKLWSPLSTSHAFDGNHFLTLLYSFWHVWNHIGLPLLMRFIQCQDLKHSDNSHPQIFNMTIVSSFKANGRQMAQHNTCIVFVKPSNKHCLLSSNIQCPSYFPVAVNTMTKISLRSRGSFQLTLSDNLSLREARAGAHRQELKQTPGRNTTCWLDLAFFHPFKRLIYCICMSILLASMSTHHSRAWCLLRSEDVGAPTTGVMDSCELSCVEIKPESFTRTSALNLWVITPALKFPHLYRPGCLPGDGWHCPQWGGVSPSTWVIH